MTFISNFFKKSPEEEEQKKIVKQARVVVTSFSDSLKKNAGKILFEIMQKNDLLDVAYYADNLSASEQEINSKNLLGIQDFSMRVFRKIPTDVIIFGHQEKEKICLNFITYGEYEELSAKSFRVLDCIYLPLDFFENSQKYEDLFANIITGAVLLCKKNYTAESKARQKSMLRSVISFFEKNEEAKNLPHYSMPYMLSFLAAIYFEYSRDNIDRRTFELIKYMLENALKQKENLVKKIHIAPLYIRIGDLFAHAAQNMHIDSLTCYKKSVQAYKLAQGYLMKNEYPYDYAQIAYLLSQTYFAQWNYTENLDALSQAVALLREVEKIYTEKLFPASWAKVEHELGYYLSVMGNYTGSPEVLNLAIQNMSNAQKVFYADKYPFIWLDVQADIGRIYYFIGKKYHNVEALKQAERKFRDAIMLCEIKNIEGERRKIDTDLAKTVELLYLEDNK